jgi:hypothetical protein
MKVNVEFIKRHPSGLKEGDTREVEFSHAARLVEQGFVKVDNWGELQAKYDEEVAAALERLKADQAKKREEEKEEELKKEALRRQNAEGKNRRQFLQTTDDIKSEEPKNSKKGGKK